VVLVSMSTSDVGRFERDVRRHVRNDAAQGVMEWLTVCKLLGERKARVWEFLSGTCREVLWSVSFLVTSQEFID